MTLGERTRFANRLKSFDRDRLYEWTGRLFKRLAKGNSLYISLVSLAMNELHSRYPNWLYLRESDETRSI